MNYDLSDEEQALYDRVAEFADEVVAPPAAYEYDTKRRLPLEIIAQMGELGLFGLPFPPEEAGGQGKSYFQLCLAVEALGRVDQSIGVTLEAGVGSASCPSSATARPHSARSSCPTSSRGAHLRDSGSPSIRRLRRRGDEDAR